MIRSQPFRLTIVHPCVGRHEGMTSYIRTWLMEPIPAAMLAGLAPDDVEVQFYDDRLEEIPFDQPTDLVAISVETYTARRAYEIATEYRQRGVPVVMGGFHATLCPEEVGRYCESLVIGEAEDLFPEVIDDYRHGTPRSVYKGSGRASYMATPDRSIFSGKKYLPIRLIEFARGCRFRCDFCAIQSFYEGSHEHRPIDRVVAEIPKQKVSDPSTRRCASVVLPVPLGAASTRGKGLYASPVTPRSPLAPGAARSLPSTPWTPR